MPLAVQRSTPLRLGSVPFRHVLPDAAAQAYWLLQDRLPSPHRSCSPFQFAPGAHEGSGTSTSRRRCSLTCSTPRHTRSCTPSPQSRRPRASSSPSADIAGGIITPPRSCSRRRKSRRRASRHARRPRPTRGPPRSARRNMVRHARSARVLGSERFRQRRRRSSSHIWLGLRRADMFPLEPARPTTTTEGGASIHYDRCCSPPTACPRRLAMLGARSGRRVRFLGDHNANMPVHEHVVGLIVERSMPPRVEPGHEPVGVPHLTGVGLVRPQTGVGLRQHFEQRHAHGDVARDWTADCGTNVRNLAFPPSPDFVAKMMRKRSAHLRPTGPSAN